MSHRPSLLIAIVAIVFSPVALSEVKNPWPVEVPMGALDADTKTAPAPTKPLAPVYRLLYFSDETCGPVAGSITLSQVQVDATPIKLDPTVKAPANSLGVPVDGPTIGLNPAKKDAPQQMAFAYAGTSFTVKNTGKLAVTLTYPGGTEKIEPDKVSRPLKLAKFDPDKDADEKSDVQIRFWRTITKETFRSSYNTAKGTPTKSYTFSLASVAKQCSLAEDTDDNQDESVDASSTYVNYVPPPVPTGWDIETADDGSSYEVSEPLSETSTTSSSFTPSSSTLQISTALPDTQ